MKVTIRGNLRGSQPTAAAKPAAPPVDICRHRGEVVAQLSGTPCSTDNRIFACAVFVHCVSRDCTRVAVRGQIEGQRLHICHGCERQEFGTGTS